MQSVVNCTEEDDVVLFDVDRTIRPSSRVTIPWNLTLSANTRNAVLQDGIFTRTRRKATFTCPRGNEGIFYIRWAVYLLIESQTSVLCAGQEVPCWQISNSKDALSTQQRNLVPLLKFRSAAQEESGTLFACIMSAS